MQEAIQEVKDEESGPFFTSRRIMIGVGILMAVLIIIGIINDATAEPNPFVIQQPFIMLALLAFVGGTLSFLAPCTLPILPAYFAFAAQSGRSQIAANTVVFMLGVATVFSLFGASASALGGLMRTNQGLILLIGGSLVIIFGVMSLLGKGFTGMAPADEGAADSRNEATSFGSTFIFGMTFAAGWSSCIGPILGIMLTMAATTSSVLRGSILLFIFALGLGLPLVIVSTFVGRASRNSLIWRLMRGKGWFVNIPSFVITAVWAFAAWLIMLGSAEYISKNFEVPALAELTLPLEVGLLAVSLLVGSGYIFATGKSKERTDLQLHTTSLFSGGLFLLMGWFMLNGLLEKITGWFIVLANESEWYQELELMLFNLFQ
ncbi:MAG: cytochrome c biogenesis CcdA family protein [Anaerolineae bacterium]